MLVFLTIFLGILDLGQLMFFQVSLTERARAGARYAVVHSFDVTTVQNVVMFNSATATAGATSGLFGLTRSMITVTRYGSGTSDDRVEVRISNFPLAFVTPFLAGDFSSKTFRAIMPVQSLGATQ
jgi:hypothetical protein